MGALRRRLAQALAASAAIGAALPSQSFAQAAPAAATEADYMRDPRRWGRPMSPRCFPVSSISTCDTRGATIRLRHGGSGPPLLLIHGNPLNHILVPDRGAPGAALSRHAAGSARLRRQFAARTRTGSHQFQLPCLCRGHDRCDGPTRLSAIFVAGHDRGGRTMHRMCMDHPERVIKAGMMDILPNYYVWTHTTKTWAIRPGIGRSWRSRSPFPSA